MGLRTSTVGSWPPLYNPDVPESEGEPDERESLIIPSIERAIQDQLELGIDILVDGQIRDDVVSLFASRFPGYEGGTLPYSATGRIRPAEEPVTATDYEYARRLAGERPLKAHITGPMTLARATTVTPESPYVSRMDPRLVMDVAQALAVEAAYLVQAGAEVIQIDEPALADGVDLSVAFAAMRHIVEKAEIPLPALHICKNITGIFEDVLRQSPVRMVSLEGAWLRDGSLKHIDRTYLHHCGKVLGVGCIDVRNYSIERVMGVQNFFDHIIDRLGEENIWAVMPNCGLRTVPHDVAMKKLKVMVTAARAWDPI